MTLRHLQIFRTVCSCESITAAADCLNMTQPAVSVAIKELEAFYRAPLFERMNRRIYLTEAGQLLLQYAGSILTQYDESVQVMHRSDSFRTCSFGINVTVGETRLPEFIREIKKELPEIKLRIDIENTKTIERRLAENTLDFAMIDQKSFPDNWKITPLYTEKMCLSCCPGYLQSAHISVAELASQRLLLREKDSAVRDSVDAMFQRHGYSVTPTIESVSMRCLIEAAALGLGMTVLPQKVVDEAEKRGELVPITLEDDAFVRTYCLVTHSKKYLTDTMRAVIRILCNCCGVNQ